MSWFDELIDRSAQLDPFVVAGLGAAAAFLVVLTIGVQWSARLLRRELDDAEEEVVDRRTGLLPRSAVRIRLGAELAWAASSNVPLAIAVLRVRGGGLRRAARALRQVMREEESAFLLGRGCIAVELWGASSHTAVLAVRRLGDQLRAAGHPAVDAGIACMPRDGGDVQTLVELARRDLRPADDPRVQADEAGRMPLGSAHVWSMVGGIMPWLAAHLLLLLCWQRLLPLTLEPLRASSNPSQSLVLWAVGVGAGVAIGTALLAASSWNLGGGTAPRSRPVATAGWRTLAALALLQGGLLAWTYAAPADLGGVSHLAGAVVASMLLVGLVLLSARQLHDLPAWIVTALVAAMAGTLWLARQVTLPVELSTVVLLLGSGAAAALVVRILARAWLLMPAAIVAALAWAQLPQVLELPGPVVGGAALLQLGIHDLVLLAAIVTWTHAWRVDVRPAGMLLVGAVVGWVLTADSSLDQPLAAWLAGVAVLLVLGRSAMLRLQASSWRAAMDAAR